MNSFIYYKVTFHHLDIEVLSIRLSY